ncbi:hypothetical protein IT415_02995 [bacterium]|nr:hypothetical protein [bacterium]
MNIILFTHLIGFAIGFGSVLLVDTVGLLWVFRKVKVSQLGWLTGIAQKLIWASVVIQVISGSILLDPEYVTIRTKIKLAAVLILVINGVVFDRIRKQMLAYKQDDFWKMPRPFQLLSVAAISLSQLCWWTATVIGFIASSR